MTELYPEFKAGIYQHYKGPHYLVLGLAHDANQEDRTAVVYIGLETDRKKVGPRLAVRTYDNFYEHIDPSTGATVEPHSPESVPRFRYLGHSALQSLGEDQGVNPPGASQT